MTVGEPDQDDDRHSEVDGEVVGVESEPLEPTLYAVPWELAATPEIAPVTKIMPSGTNVADGDTVHTVSNSSPRIVVISVSHVSLPDGSGSAGKK